MDMVRIVEETGPSRGGREGFVGDGRRGGGSLGLFNRVSLTISSVIMAYWADKDFLTVSNNSVCW